MFFKREIEAEEEAAAVGEEMARPTLIMYIRLHLCTLFIIK